jgi:hypothetical protein
VPRHVERGVDTLNDADPLQAIKLVGEREKLERCKLRVEVAEAGVSETFDSSEDCDLHVGELVDAAQGPDRRGAGKRGRLRR